MNQETKPAEDKTKDESEPALLCGVIRDCAIGARPPRRDGVLAPFASKVQTRPGGALD